MSRDRGDRFDLHELSWISQDGDPEERARYVVRAESRGDGVPGGDEIGLDVRRHEPARKMRRELAGAVAACAYGAGA